ncbi:MAG: amidohydrolase family protein [Proteobacteria bacterium]|nr:amidohydrolase family protein [Pseudomonadota bacterium]
MIVDAHAHLWCPSRRQDDILILAREPSLAGDAMPDRLLPLMTQYGIGTAAIIQSAPSLGHSRFCLETAERHERLPAVMGWLDLDSEDFGSEKARATMSQRFAGIRIMLNRMPEAARVLEPRCVANVRALARDKCAIELLAMPEHLPLIADLANVVDEGLFIVDHAGQPDLRAPDQPEWRADMRRLAQRSNVLTKVSGLAERKGIDWTPRDLQPIVAFLFDNFTAERLMFATNWPVCDLVGGMGRWIEGLDEIVTHLGLGRGERTAFYAHTAMRALGANRFRAISG